MNEKEFTEKLINRFLIEMKKNDRSGVYAISQRMLAYNSNRIEGSTLTEEQTASLFDTGTLNVNNDVVRAKDVEEMTGHFLMFNEMLKTFENPISEELIKTYHYKLKSGVFEDALNGYPVGEYKNRFNVVSSINTCPPKEVPLRMKELIDSYLKIEHPKLSDLARFHVEYELIHPFQDGNGRTGRIILFKECLKNKIIPFIISDNRKKEYYESLKDAQLLGNFDKLETLFADEQKNYCEKVIDFVIDYQELDEIALKERLNVDDLKNKNDKDFEL